jgi:Glycosyl transferase family 2
VISLLKATWRLAEEAIRRRVGLRRRAPARLGNLLCVQNRIEAAGRPQVLLVCCLAGADHVEPYFLKYYRKLGVQHFLFVDATNAKGAEVALGEPDCSVWTTSEDVESNGQGAFWINALLNRYANGRLAVFVGCDDFLIYPWQGTRNLSDLRQFLNDDRKETVHALIVEGYCGNTSEGADLVDADLFRAGVYFDRDGYIQSWAPRLRTRIQGGPSLRVQSREHPESAPERDCIPVILWGGLRGYRHSNQELFPSQLNRAHKPGEVSLSAIVLRLSKTAQGPDGSVYTPGISVPCDGWRRFVDLGLCSPGNWV